jgi:hypothetical protein
VDLDEPLTTRPMAAPEFRQALEHDALVRLGNLVPQASRDSCRPMTRPAHGKAYREILGIAAEDSADAEVLTSRVDSLELLVPLLENLRQIQIRRDQADVAVALQDPNNARRHAIRHVPRLRDRRYEAITFGR